ncbi:hypothetical protein [Succinimonas sp.]|uniref:hypothetical protein n=1 Tax=Succinimonas sp. TaxID=1936151 RepID=UPI00386E8C80
MIFNEMPHDDNPLIRLLKALEAPDMVFAVISSAINMKQEYPEALAKYPKILDNDRRRNSQLANLADDYGFCFWRIASHYQDSETGEKISDNFVLIESEVRNEAFLKLFCETAARVFNRESYLFKASNGMVTLCFPDAPDSELGVFRTENFSELMSAFVASGNRVKSDQCALRKGIAFDLIADNRPKLHRGQYSWQVINGRRDYLQEHRCFPPSIKKWLSDWPKIDADPDMT